ncbi:uncharacterized protein N7458_010009 [Penicillium daleae]|uniref:Uncharacterized protein n=1 Tax=Penicillium daleae TaxID=63821 RepID=A0AAD6C0B5_9EURO|nr:uncharacterized protein N7458_010009 [Penicillium daleae]KAJ5439011.1 hypothetical protein N7458_010009 [Penicillium daleae]
MSEEDLKTVFEIIDTSTSRMTAGLQSTSPSKLAKSDLAARSSFHSRESLSITGKCVANIHDEFPGPRRGTGVGMQGPGMKWMDGIHERLTLTRERREYDD